MTVVAAHRRVSSLLAVLAIVVASAAAPVRAADYPTPVERDWIARDFRFHTGEVVPELRLHVTTVGDPAGEPVLVLHGTAGSGSGFLAAAFAGELFGPGQPLDAKRYYIILPDAIGAGKSARPSDDLRTRFPRYDYVDMVEAQFRLVSEGLGVRHLRAVIGNSMGGMHAWLWGERHPGFMDTIVPMACQPTEMAGRNWMMRRLLVESIRSDPGWQNGNYATQPRGVALALTVFGTATSGGSQAYHAQAPNRAKADELVAARLAAPVAAVPVASPAALANAARAPGQHLERVLIKDGANVHVIPVELVDWIEAQDDYVGVRAEGKTHLKPQPIAEIAAALDPARFVRIHRSYVLNVDRLARLELYAKDSRIAILKDGKQLPVSRAGYARLKELL